MDLMKVVITSDGSNHAIKAIDGLANAGLPSEGAALVVTVAEVWLPPPESSVASEKYIEEVLRRHRERGERMMREARAVADIAAFRVSKVLPGWKIEPLATYGSPAWAILTAADEFNADLIVVGSHGESGIERLVLGSISQKVLTEANCSVRVSRERKQVLDGHSVRIVIGYDGLSGAEAAVDAVAGRKWPADTQVKLVIAADPSERPLVERLIAPFGHSEKLETPLEHRWISALAHEASKRLMAGELNVSTILISGKPRDVILKEAREWDSDCIFLGANAYGGRFERFLLGSTSAAVAARAHCTVEVARRR